MSERSPYSPPDATVTDPDGGDRKAALEAGVGYKNTQYYLPRFQRFEESGTSVTWNWAAFFISFFWLLYRKMWLWALLYFFSSWPLSIVDAVIGVPAVSIVIWVGYLVGIFVVFPMYANAIYYRHVCQKISAVDQQQPGPERRLGMIASSGGTSGIALALIVVFLFVPVIGILAAVAIPAYQDYTIRARVQEAVAASQPHRTDVTIACAENTLSAGTNNSTLDVPAEVDSQYVTSIEVAGIDERTATVTIWTANLGPRVEGAIVYTANCATNPPQWSVSSETIAAKYLPRT